MAVGTIVLISIVVVIFSAFLIANLYLLVRSIMDKDKEDAITISIFTLAFTTAFVTSIILK